MIDELRYARDVFAPLQNNKQCIFQTVQWQEK